MRFVGILCAVLGVSAFSHAQGQVSSVAGVLTDSLGAAAIGEITLEWEGKGEVAPGSASMTTDRNGSFRFDGLRKGRYLIIGRLKGEALPAERLFMLDEGEEMTFSLHLGEPEAACSAVGDRERVAEPDDAQKGEIIRAVLAAAATHFDSIGKRINGKIPLSEENLLSGWLPQEDDPFIPVDEDRLQALSDRDGGMTIMKVRSAKFTGMCAEVRTDLLKLHGRGSAGVSLDGVFLTYEVRRFGNGWHLRLADRKQG